MLTGTGACVFARLESEAEAVQLLDEVRCQQPTWHAFKALGLNRSPLLDALPA